MQITKKLTGYQVGTSSIIISTLPSFPVGRYVYLFWQARNGDSGGRGGIITRNGTSD